jgi:K+-sensing histidine kinase KdpD
MEQRKPQISGAQSPIRVYGLAFCSISLAVGAALVLDRYFAREVEVPLLLFAVAVSAWYGRVAAAILALILDCLSFDYFFVQPLYAFYITASDIPYFAISPHSRQW